MANAKTAKGKAYNKVVAVIESSKTKLHVDFCNTMIAMFHSKYSDMKMYLDLRDLLDSKANSLYLN